MARSKIGFITGVGGNPTGIGDYVLDLDEQGIPAVIMANDTTTGLSDILGLSTSVNHVMLFRVVRDGSEQYSVPNYDLDPYDAAVQHWDKIKPFFPMPVTSNKSRVWIQPINEVDKNRADWLGYFGVEIANIANISGYKVAMFGWASGEPEPEHWLEPGMVSYLEYCHNSPNMAGIALHEYDYGMVGMENTFPYHVGRFNNLFDACERLGLNKPKVLVSEFGWAYTQIPSTDQCMSDIDYAARLYAQHNEILGAGIWYLGPGFSDIADEVNGLIAPVTNYTIDNELPGPPEDTGDNVMVNPSFELGWYHPSNIPELQIPNDWMFWNADEALPNPYDPAPHSKWVRPEVRTLPKSSLPPNEQGLFVLDGEYTVKVFKGHGSIWHSWFQQIPAGAGNWTLEINVFPDLVDSYLPDGTKVFATDPNSCIVWVELENGIKSEELRPVIGRWNALKFDIGQTDSNYFDVHFLQPFPLENNGLFLDKWSLKDMGDGCEPIAPYKRVVWVYPQNTTKEQYLELASQAWDEDRRTLTGSYDDAGIGCGLTSKTAVLFGIDEDLKQTFIDWYSDNYPGTMVEFRPLPPSP